MMLKVFYSCVECGLVKVDAEVPERGADDPVVHWVSQTVGLAVKQNHSLRSPRCQAKSMQNLLIPMSGAKRIGNAVQQ